MEQKEKTLYRCGTLTYTKIGLINMAVWLLWGDFSLVLLNNVFPALTPLQLNLHNASNATIGLLMGTIPSIVTFIANPIISTSSDRTRSRWGRRIPYLLFSAPFTAMFMILLGWSDYVGKWLMKLVSYNGDPSLFIIVVMSICVIGYSIFQMFSDSVFWYIFADVVPDQFMGRFMAAFRVIGAVGGMVFNYFVMPYAKTHTAIIFTVIALIYWASFSAMCIQVKEGEYPPPEKYAPGIFSIFKGFFKDCFSTSFYVILFIGLSMNYVSTLCRNNFNFLFALYDLKLTPAEYGETTAIGLAVAAVLFMPMGFLVDKIHPIRVYLFGALLVIFVNPYGFYCVKDYKTFMIMSIMLQVVYTVQYASMFPLNVKLFPLAKYGQFCSAAAMMKAVMLALGGWASGWFVDQLGYRYLYVWDFCFTIICFVLLYITYIQWKKMGGDKSFEPPVK